MNLELRIFLSPRERAALDKRIQGAKDIRHLRRRLRDEQTGSYVVLTRTNDIELVGRLLKKHTRTGLGLLIKGIKKPKARA